MADGTVSGRFDLEARSAIGALKSIRDEGIAADTALANLGKTMDTLGGATSDTRLASYKRKLGDVAKTAETTATKVAASWNAQAKAIDVAATKIEGRIDRLQNKLDEYGRGRHSAQISLDGFAEVNAQLREVQGRLNAIGRRNATARVSTSGGGAGLGASAASAASGGGGGGLPGIMGLPGAPLLLGALGLSPGILALAGGATALAGSATSAGLGAGAIGLGAYGTLGVGAGLSAAGIVPAVHNLTQLTQAQQKYTTAVKEFGRASTQAATAKRTYDAAVAQGTPAEVSAATQIRLAQGQFRRSTGAASGSVYRAAGRLAYDARSALRNGVGSDINYATAATAGAATSFGGFLTNPQSLRTLQLLTGSFVGNLPQMESSLEHVATILENLAVDAIPFFSAAVTWVDHWTAGMAKSSGDTGKVSTDIQKMVDSLKDWGRLGGAVFDTVKDLFTAGTPSGDSMVVQLTKTFDRWDKWIEKHPEKVQKWFDSAAKTTEHIGRVVGHVVGDVSKIAQDLTPMFNRGLTFVDDLSQLGGGGIKGLLTIVGGYEGLRLLTKGGLPSAGRVARSVATGNPTSLFGGSDAIVGARGSRFKAGSLMNPIAVINVDEGGSPIGGRGGGGRGGRGPVEEGGVGATTAAEGAAGGGGAARLLSRGRSFLTRAGERATRGGAYALAGYAASQFVSPALQIFGVHKRTANEIGGVAGDTALGAGIGSAVPGVGTGVGALIGALYGIGAHVPIPRSELTAGGAAGISSAVTSQLARTGGQPGYARTAQQLAAYTTQAQHSAGGFGGLSVADLKAVQAEAKSLAADPSLKEYASRITAVGQAATDALVKKAQPAFKDTASVAGDSLNKIVTTTTRTTGQIQTTLGKGTAQARDTVAANYEQAAKDIATSMQNGVIATAQGITAINKMLSKALRALGMNVSPALVSAIGVTGAEGLINRAQTGGTGASSDTGTSTTGGSGHGATFATGGLLDTLDLGGGARGAPGEAWIANRHTMNELSSSTLRTHGKTAWQMIRDETRPHSAPFARGGDLGGAIGGGRSLHTVLPGGQSRGSGGATAKMSALLDYARSHNVYGEDGLCLTHVEGFMEAVGYPGGTHGVGHPYAWDFGTDARAHAGAWGLELLGSGDPYNAPAGAVVVVPHPNPGTSLAGPNPGEAGDISVASGTGQFYNGGQNSYGGPGAVSNAILLAPAGYGGGAVRGGGGGGVGVGGFGVNVPRLRAPRIRGGGAIGLMGQGAVNAATKAANRYLQNKAGSLGGGNVGLVPGGGAVISQIGRELMANGLNRIGAAGIIGNALQESGWNPASVGSGGGGLWGFTAGDISLASLQSFAAGEHMPWTNPKVQTQFLLDHLSRGDISSLNSQGSPAAAASWFMNNWEHPLLATENEARRQQGANQAFSMGYARGGPIAWGGWNARGASFMTNGPTLFGAGEGGKREHVSITPAGSAGGGITVNMYNPTIGSHGEARKLGALVAQEIIDAMNRVGNGASDAQLMGADA